MFLHVRKENVRWLRTDQSEGKKYQHDWEKIPQVIKNKSHKHQQKSEIRQKKTEKSTDVKFRSSKSLIVELKEKVTQYSKNNEAVLICWLALFICIALLACIWFHHGTLFFYISTSFISTPSLTYLENLSTSLSTLQADIFNSKKILGDFPKTF